MRTIALDGRYAMLDRLGEGGMGEVYLAHDELLGRRVALKVLREPRSRSAEFVMRFRREARSAAVLSHPNVVAVYDAGEFPDGTPYIAMEYLSGGTLRDRLLERGVFAARTASAVALQIAGALCAAHERGLVHRDVKPENVLVTEYGDVKVADFGIARAADATAMTETSRVLGTVRYLSPEQAMGDRVGPASDLYSLGVVLYEMLTGMVPFEAEGPLAIAMKHVTETPRSPRQINPCVPEALEAVTMRLLAKDPAGRYPDARALVEDLERVCRELSGRTKAGDREGGPAATTARIPRPPAAATVSRIRRRRRNRRTLSAFVAVVALAPLAAMGGTDPLNLTGGAPSAPVAQVVAPEVSGVDVPLSPKVPDVRGATQKGAEEKLREAGFKVAVERKESGEDQAGKVLMQSPAAGAQAARGSTVTITIGEGPSMAVVPELVGLSVAEAEVALHGAGLSLGTRLFAASTTVPAGFVLYQDTPASTEVPEEASVGVTVSSGPPLSSVPPAEEEVVQRPRDDGMAPAQGNTPQGRSQPLRPEPAGRAGAAPQGREKQAPASSSLFRALGLGDLMPGNRR